MSGDIGSPGEMATLAVGRQFPTDVIADESHIYWLEFSDGAIYRAEHDGSEPTLVFSGSYGGAVLVADDDSLYWTAGDSVWVSDKRGDDPRTIITGVERIHSLLLSDTDLYISRAQADYSAPADGWILKVPKSSIAEL